MSHRFPHAFIASALFASLFVAVHPVPAQPIIHVDDDAPPGGDGLTWPTAFDDLQDGLAAAASAASGGNEVEVHAAQGTYQPAGTGGDREATFQLINNVALRGGYTGLTAPDPDARDIDLYETILSGDLNGDDAPDMQGNDENSFRVVTTAMGSEPTTVVDGLTIPGGNGGKPISRRWWTARAGWWTSAPCGTRSSPT